MGISSILLNHFWPKMGSKYKRIVKIWDTIIFWKKTFDRMHMFVLLSAGKPILAKFLAISGQAVIIHLGHFDQFGHYSPTYY